jgi:hypothetical protein
MDVLGLHLPACVRAVAKHQKRRLIRSRRASHVMNMHLMQPLFGLTHIGKMLIMANAQDNTCATFKI